MNFLGLEYGIPLFIEGVYTERTRRLQGGNFQGSRTGTLRWRCGIRFEIRGFDDALPDLAMHRAEYGQTQPFLLPMPQYDLTAHAETPTVTDDVKQQNDVVQLQNGTTVTIRKGRFIAFASQAKVYQVRETVQVGNATAVKILPPLVADLATGTNVTLQPDLWCVYERASGGRWEVNQRNVVAPQITVQEV